MKTLSPPDMVKAKYLGRLPLFAEFPQAERDALAPLVQIRTYEKGEVLFRAGEESSTLFALLRGSAQISLHLPNGDRKVLHLITPPSFLAEGAVLTGQPFPADATSSDESLILTLPRDTLYALTVKNPQLPWAVMGGLFRKLKEFKNALENHSRKSALSRVSVYLLGIAPDCPQVVLPGPKKDVANYLGLRPESLSRALRTLADRGAITISGDTMRIESRNKLEELLRE